MFDGIVAFFTSVANAELDFAALGAFFASVYETVILNEELMNIWNTAMGAISSFAPFVPYILLALSVIIVIFGKKLIGVLRFIACVVIGYVAGVLYVSPLINQVLLLPNYISGIVIAVVAAVLAKYVYFAAYTVAVAYSVYVLTFSPLYIPFLAGLTHGNGTVCVIVMAVVLVLSLVFLKYVEMFGTALLGGFLISKCVIVNFIDYPALIGDAGFIVELVAIFVIGIVGFTIQYKTRTRY